MNKKILKLIALSVAVVITSLTLTLGVAAAYPKHTDYISDKAVILDEKTEENVVKASDKLFRKKNVRIAVCTVLDTDGESIQSYGSNLFRKWKIGDGVLILLSINDDNFYAVQSNSLSEYLSEKDLKKILSNSLEPSFAEKAHYSEGVQDTVYALSNHLTNSVPEDFGEDKDAGLPGWAVAIIVILVIIVVIVGGGFGAIIFLRKKNARRRREEMELRRRRLAEGRGRDIPRNPAQYPPRRPQGTISNPQRGGYNGRPGMNPTMQGQGRPMQPGAPRPQNRPGTTPGTQGNNTPQARNHASNAATIQINTSDIRAAKQNRRP